MSDLISRSALIKVLKGRATNEAIMGYMTAYDVTNSIIDEVEEQPTAYDIDKVVEELKEIKDTHESNIGVYCATDRAIEIVKQGGVGTETETIRDKAVKWNNNSTKRVPYEFIDYVEGKREIGVSDDVCEWRLCDEEANVYDTSCRNPHILINGTPEENNYKFCPYCGKKIKVVE